MRNYEKIGNKITAEPKDNMSVNKLGRIVNDTDIIDKKAFRA